jgi:8-oxo-dGTP diphosphatase
MLKKIAGKIWRNMLPSWRLRIIRLTQHQFTVSVAAIVVNESNEILLLDHVLRPGSGWGIPGGFLMYDEQPIDAVRRELQEETGIELNDVKLLSARTINRHIEILFRARADGTPIVKSREINSLGWFKVNEMPEKMDRKQKSIIEKHLHKPVRDLD